MSYSRHKRQMQVARSVLSMVLLENEATGLNPIALLVLALLRGHKLKTTNSCDLTDNEIRDAMVRISSDWDCSVDEVVDIAHLPQFEGLALIRNESSEMTH